MRSLDCEGLNKIFGKPCEKGQKCILKVERRESAISKKFG